VGQEVKHQFANKPFSSMKINYLRRVAGMLTLALAVMLASSCSKDDDEDDDENIEDPKKAFFEEKLPMP
jgi:hypothetical protein